jgi:formate dehydrogenase subunit gamma
MAIKQTTADLEISSIIAAHSGRPGALLPMLHALQAAFGCIPPGSVKQIAAALNQTEAEIHGVISFYHDFRTTAPPLHALQLCQAEACQAMDARSLTRHAEQCLKISLGQERADGQVGLRAVYCLGLCAVAPAALLDGKPHGRLTAGRLDRLLGAAGLA